VTRDQPNMDYYCYVPNTTS